MPLLTPVDDDPFNSPSTLTPVDHDPWGVVPKQGQTVQPTDVKGQLMNMPGHVAAAAAQVLGVPDIESMTPEEQQMFALGAVPMMVAPEARAVGPALRGAEEVGAYLSPYTHMPIKGTAFEKATSAAKDYVASLPKGYGPLDLSLARPVPNIPQEAIERWQPARGISPRVQDALNNPDVVNGVRDSINQGIGMGAHLWYHTEPIRAAFEKEFGENWQQPFKLFMDTQAAASPRSDVPTQIRNGSWMYAHAMNGMPLPDKGPEIYPYGHLAGNLHRQNFDTIMGGGWDVIKNPKPPSFSANLQGNLEPGTIDTHAFRNIGMRSGDPRFLATQIQEIIPAGREVGPNSAAAKYGEISEPDEDGVRVARYRPQQLVKSGKLSMEDAKTIPAFWAAQPNANEYAAIEQLYKRLGSERGLPTADAQAAAWAGGGKLTGLGTTPDRTFPELMNERIMYTSHLRGEAPEKVLSDMIRARKPLLGIGGAAAAGTMLEENWNDPNQ